MKKIIFYPLLLLTWLSISQAAAQVNNDARPQVKTADVLFELLPVAGKGYLSVFTDDAEAPTKVRLTFIGATQTVESEQELSLVRRGLAGMVESAFIWNGELTLLTSLFYPGPQRDQLFIRRFSIPDLEEVAAEKITEAYVPGRLRIPFGYALSPDSTNIMFYSWTYAVPKDPVKMEIHVFNRELEPQWNKRFLLPNKNANFYIYACKVDNAGNAYLLCEDYKGRVGGRIQEDKIERFVLRLDQNSSDATSYSINLGDKVISDLRFTMDQAGNLYGGGIYREAGKLNQAGVFAYRIDQQTQGFQKQEIPIDRDAYWAMHPYAGPDGKHFSGTRRFYDYFVDRVHWDDTQGLTLVGEQRIFEEDDEDRYNDILVVQLDTNLQKKWIIRIPKLQTTRRGGSDFSSYSFLLRGDKQYILFNDHAENMPDESGSLKRVKNLNFALNNSSMFIHMIQIAPSGLLRHRNLNEVIQTKGRLALVPAMTRSDRQNAFLLYLKDINNLVSNGAVFPISWLKDE